MPISQRARPRQNTVSLRNGRVLISVGFDGASPCLTSYSFVKGLRPADRERLSVIANPTGWTKAFRRARNDGHLMPVRFDDRPSGMTALVLLGEHAPEFESEWMGRAAWWLNVPCGYLGVSAGIHLLEVPDGYAGGNDPYFKYVAVPPGEYLVEVLAYLPADEVLFHPKGGSRRFPVPGRPRGVPIGAYFRRTRPNEPLPDWLTAYLLEYPYCDPGHEEEWEDREDDDVEVEGCLLHVIRLTPVQPGEPVLRRPRDLWLPFELRSLPKCPRGLPLRGKVK
jgi:hypothetical protein